MREQKHNEPTQSTFRRIGDTYGSFIDPHHFMGRAALEDFWLKRHNAPVNVTYGPKAYIIEMALPGYHKDDISVNVKDDMVEVVAKRRDPNGGRFVVREMWLDHVKRRFDVPRGVFKDKINATFSDGMLTIKMPHNNKLTSREIQIG